MANSPPRQLTRCNSSFSIPDYLGWRSGDNCVFWNISIHDTTRANYGPTTNPAGWQDHATCTDQHIVADNDPVRMNLRLINDELAAISDLFRSANDSAIWREANIITNDNIALARREMIETANCALQSKTDIATT
jgi:hypothetical protein